jgi:hypothetical protein
MPKVKKIRSAALQSHQVRHEPLGQVIEGDELKGKYAAPIRVGRKIQRGSNDEDGEYLDAKTSQKILKLTEQQEMEVQAEDHRNFLRQTRPKRGQNTTFDSDEEVDEEETEDIIIDEEDE